MLFTSEVCVSYSLPVHYTGSHFRWVDSTSWYVIQRIGPHYTVWICSHWRTSEPLVFFSFSVSFSWGSGPNLIASSFLTDFGHIFYYTIGYTGSFFQLPVSVQWVAPREHIVLMHWLGILLLHQSLLFQEIGCTSLHY